MFAKHRRTRVVRQAAEAGVVIAQTPHAAQLGFPDDTIEEKFAILERADRIEQLLSELKARRQV